MRRYVLSQRAANDIDEILVWSLKTFGPQTGARYEILLYQAMVDVTHDPQLTGSFLLEELGPGLHIYHRHHSRMNVADEKERVKSPRHFLVYRLRGEQVEIVRILHDAMDLKRHV